MKTLIIILLTISTSAAAWDYGYRDPPVRVYDNRLNTSQDNWDDQRRHHRYPYDEYLPQQRGILDIYYEEEVRRILND